MLVYSYTSKLINRQHNCKFEVNLHLDKEINIRTNSRKYAKKVTCFSNPF